MARSSECTEQYAQKVFDSAGIVRDTIRPAIVSSSAEVLWHNQDGLAAATKRDSQRKILSTVISPPTDALL